MPEVAIRLQGHDETTDVFKKVENAGKKSAEVINKSWEKAGERIKQVGERVTQAGFALSKLSAPFAIVGGAAVKMAADIEDSLANVSTLIKGDSVPAINEMSDGIKRLLREVPKTADDLGASLYGILSAGITESSDAINVLEHSSKLAVAGLGTTAEATDLMTIALNAFGIEADKANDVSDVLFKTVKNGITTVSKLAVNFGTAAGNAVAINVTLEELQASTAALTSVTGKTAEAQTRLSALFRELSQDGSALDKSLKKGGSSLAKIKQTIKERGLIAALEEARDLTKSTDEQFKNMFGSAEAGTAAFMLLTSANKAYKDTLDDMLNGSNAVTEAFEKKTKTVKALWQITKNKVNVALISLGEKILPRLVPIIETVGEVAERLGNKFESLPESVQNMILLGGAIVAAIGPAVVILGSLISSVGAVVTGIGALAGALGVSVAGLLGPIAAIGAGIALLSVAWAKNWGDIQGRTAATVSWLKGLMGPWFEEIKAGFQRVSADISAAWAEISNTLGPTVMEIVDLISTNWPTISSVIETVLKIAWTAIKWFTVIAYELFSTNLKAIWEVFKWFFETVGPVIAETMKFWIELFAAGWPRMKEIIDTSLRSIESMLSSFMNTFRNSGLGLMKAFANGLTSGALLPYNVFKNAMAKVRSLLPGSDAKEGPLSDITGSGSGMMEAFSKGLQDGTPALIAQVTESMEAVHVQVLELSNKAATKMTKEQLKAEAERAKELADQRRYDNLDRIKQMEETAAKEIALSQKHGAETAEIERYWATQIYNERQRQVEEQAFTQQRLADQRKRQIEEEAMAEQRLAATKAGVFGQMSDAAGAFYQLSGEQTVGFFLIQKAAAIAEGTIMAHLAALKALAAIPPPWNIAAAAAIYAQAIAQVASIASQTIALAEGGIVTSPTLALIGEAGPEKVIPLSEDDTGPGDVIQITVNIIGGVWTARPEDAQKLVRFIRPYLESELSR